MSDMLLTASAFIATQRRAHMSRTVTYRRVAAQESVSATVGKTVFRTDGGNGVFVHAETRDYLIDVADLAAFESPRRGDVIVETINNITEAYQVTAPDGEDVFKLENDRTVYRVHTQYNGVDTGLPTATGTGT